MEAVVLQAVNDYRAASCGSEVDKETEEELSCFFCGEWGQSLLGEIDGRWLYEKLKTEAASYKHGGGVRKIRKRKG